MEFFRHNTTIDFMGVRKYAVLFSILLFLASISSLIINGLNLGLDFKSGLQIEVTYEKPVDTQVIRNALMQGGIKDAVVQIYGQANDLLITLGLPKNFDTEQGDNGAAQQRIKDQLIQLLPGATVQRVDFVGPQLGKELATKGALALVIAFLGAMIYLMLRFEYRFAISAIVALIHDPMLILGIFSFFRIEFDVNALSALLAVIGYSLNEAIVIFDRVRENFRKVRKGTPLEIMNLSINQTLSRTVITGGSAFTIVTVLFFFGGAMIHSFALAMMIGILIGMYSSMYIAGALALAMGLDRKDLLPAPKAVLDDRP